jgi:CHAD domain-containing protein
MKVREVPGLTPKMELAEAARRIVAVRAGEVFALAPAALADEDPRALHAMRIAAKRLRYVLELIGPCVGEVAGDAERRMRELQTLLGDIHDCDVLLDRLAAAGQSESKGMRRLAERLRARRKRLFREFATLWGRIESSALQERIVAATSYSPNGASAGA